MNHVRTFVLLAALTALFGAVGYMIGGTAGMMIALAVAVIGNGVAYWNADKIVLSQYRAQPVDAAHPSPLIRDYVSDTLDLAQKAGLPPPRIHVIETDQPNAFATGRDPAHAAVVATTGLLGMLSRDEIRGVMAHELAHVKHRDTLTMTITATIAGAVAMLANFAFFFSPRDSEGRSNPLVGVLVMVLAPIAASLVQFAISRSREYEADRLGAEISGDPGALARALQKIEHAAHLTINSTAEQNPATAHLFIINPLHGRSADNLFSTHPSTANRIARLRGFSDRAAPAPLEYSSESAPGPWGPRRRGPWG